MNRVSVLDFLRAEEPGRFQAAGGSELGLKTLNRSCERTLLFRAEEPRRYDLMLILTDSSIADWSWM